MHSARASDGVVAAFTNVRRLSAALCHEYGDRPRSAGWPPLPRTDLHLRQGHQQSSAEVVLASCWPSAAVTEIRRPDSVQTDDRGAVIPRFHLPRHRGLTPLPWPNCPVPACAAVIWLNCLSGMRKPRGEAGPGALSTGCFLFAGAGLGLDRTFA